MTDYTDLQKATARARANADQSPPWWLGVPLCLLWGAGVALLLWGALWLLA